MRRGRAARHFLRAAAIWLFVVASSPLVVVAGESVRRYVLASPAARPTRRRAGRVRRFLMLVVTNPLWIALTAPARWLIDRAGGHRRRPWRPPPDARVREPRRPGPGRPSGSVALAEPRAEPVIARLLGTASRGPRHGDGREGSWRQGNWHIANGRWRIRRAN